MSSTSSATSPPSSASSPRAADGSASRRVGAPTACCCSRGRRTLCSSSTPRSRSTSGCAPRRSSWRNVLCAPSGAAPCSTRSSRSSCRTLRRRRRPPTPYPTPQRPRPPSRRPPPTRRRIATRSATCSRTSRRGCRGASSPQRASTPTCDPRREVPTTLAFAVSARTLRRGTQATKWVRPPPPCPQVPSAAFGTHLASRLVAALGGDESERERESPPRHVSFAIRMSCDSVRVAPPPLRRGRRLARPTGRFRDKYV
mmetsp:Transcript_69157/g.184091  ORF Transcript_69157/g.184091 Transcript_69157/m.184091 type:complete len:256 (-) Transcript_69157:20-787(-)